ncbi:MAG: ABC transporter ATP-binding protein [Acidobacteria bacterium]|nr:MAG: ABC transporter ATP-binding protein [Acidobacteriota bacterium]
MLQIQSLTKAYAGRVLFDDVTWNVSDGDRVALAGPNGSGKTTLLRIILRSESPDSGKVSTPRGTTIGYLPQEGLAHSGKTLRAETLTAFEKLLAMGEEMRELEEQMGAVDAENASHERILERYGECRDEWDRRGGFSIESRAEEVLLGLGFKTEELDLPTETFSGGWQMRIALAKLLLSQPNLLLLDEPTNHLDLEARNWLEDYLANYPHAIVLVSHDRYFIDQVATRITDIDRRRLVDYTGNYSTFLETRANSLAELRAKAARQKEEIEKTERFINKFRYKATKAKQVQSRVKMLEKMEKIEVPPERKLMRLRLPEVERSGRVVLELENIHKSYGDNHVFEGANLLVERGERMALVGPNGVGKSTLMRLLAEIEDLDSGKLRLGHNVKTGYFSQDRYDLDEERTVLENMTDGAPTEMIPRLRSLLGAFLFHGDDVDKKVKVLSGGEKSRLALARMLLRPANVLLLDEPSNHLDLDSKQILLEALRAYKGTLVFVSHDRYLLDQLSTKVAEIADGHIHVHWGGYPDFIRAKDAQLEAPVAVKKEIIEEPVPSKVPAEGKALSKNKARAIQERLEEIETTISETEIGIDSLEGRMSVAGFYDDDQAAAGVVKTHEDLKAQLKALYVEWEELAQKASAFC